MKNQAEKPRLSGGTRAFFKAMVVTLSVVLLILIGYFTAGFFAGGI